MFRAKHLKTGQKGEDIASDFLKAKGHKIITRNYRTPWSEIDIISLKKDGTLSFTEVKTLASYNKEIRQENFAGNSLQPEDNLTRSKLEKLQKACIYFANRNPKLIHEKRGWQIDLVTLTIPKSENGEVSTKLTNGEENFLIKYYENIYF